MKILPISSDRLGKYKKNISITPDMQKNLNTILNRMKQATSVKSDEKSFEVSHINRISTKDGVTLSSGGMTVGRPEDYVTTVSWKNVALDIDNSTGEILFYEKPLLKSWTKIMRKLETSLNNFSANFDNSGFVQKNVISNKAMSKDMTSKITEPYYRELLNQTV